MKQKELGKLEAPPSYLNESNDEMEAYKIKALIISEKNPADYEQQNMWESSIACISADNALYMHLVIDLFLYFVEILYFLFFIS